MNSLMIVNALDYRTNKPIRVSIKDGIISDIAPCNEKLAVSNFIAPGLVDLQVNGFKGIDLNALQLNESEVKKLCEFLLEEGITSFFPTVITNSSNAISSLLHSIAKACDTCEKTNACMGGIHLEGPFISKEDGPRGAHDVAFVKAPDWDLFSEWQLAAGGRIRIITLSPEWPESTAFIKKCVASGVIVSIGHTAATPDQIQNAIKAGASMSTHLGNASHALLPRHSNYVFEQLASEKLWSTIIADGFHLPDALIKIFLKSKPTKSILISDTTSYAGLPAGSYSSHIGGDIVLDTAGKLHIKNQPHVLAGSAQSLLWCVNQLLKKNIVPIVEAWNMASIKPTEAVYGSSTNLLKVGYPADLVIFKKDKANIKIVETIKSGQTVFSNIKKY